MAGRVYPTSELPILLPEVGAATVLQAAVCNRLWNGSVFFQR